jgi:hypothetical protein
MSLCNSGDVYEYICRMNNEITIPDLSPDFSEEDLKTAAKRREKYSIVRDLLAKENNEAIAQRLKQDKEKGVNT